ncbi:MULTISPECIES: class I adenylate-forming enzyme family protein [unclassified Brevibacterium]|uniref:class I adenylate-forming enzyme family protein n=1 Tax=unclassified Brevibacterium TaxID=2614124 RepID=UPI0010931F6D|nr:class I adenylate-forming enzyme family protein [Brevibacterium sp. S22]TGD32785.1 long-chain fatty acid--CoA ligase [Brevibacterium sp. S22]
MPITSTILDVALERPDQPAIVGTEARLTYAQLAEDSRTMSTAVDALHAEQADPPTPAAETQGIPITAVSLTSAFETSRTIAGLAGFRAVSATIDPRWPLDHQVGVITTTGIGVVISDSTELAEALAAAGWTGTVITAADFHACEAAIDLAETAPPTVRDDAEPFLMLFSSGTTSNPKAFIKTRRQYRDNVAVSSAHLEPFPGVATLAPGPVSYSLTLYAVIESLATGGSVHVADDFDPFTMGSRIADEAITRIVAVPAVVKALAEAARRTPERFRGLDLVVTGGANLPASIRSSLGEVLPDTRLISYYGAAEIGFIGDSRDGDGTWITVYDTIGAEVRGDDGVPLPDGEIGTLWIKAAACSDDYVTGTTGEVLRGPDGWASVGDQGRIENGLLQLAGRAGDIAITGGHKVSLPEVERAFETFSRVGTAGDGEVAGDGGSAGKGQPDLGEVCAIALPDDSLGSIVALVVEGGGTDKAALLAHARAQLAPQFVPRRFYAIDRLPRTVGGKIRRSETVELIMSGKARRL